MMAEWEPWAVGLAYEVTHPHSRWWEAVALTPRHVFVPRWWETVESGGWELHDGPSDVGAWLAAAYSNRTLVTRVGSLHADGATGADRPLGLPSSSSTLPGLVVQMLRHARPVEGADVLDIGTGSGYSSAMLARRFGAERVTSIDVDSALTDAAAERLDGIGLRPRVLTCDATGDLPGTFDRIVSMVSVPTIPTSWLKALKPGGRLVTTITNTSLIIGADATADGGAVGRVARDWAGFMGVRHGADYPPGILDGSPSLRIQEGEEITVGRYPVLDVAQAWEVRSMLELTAPGVETHFEADGHQRTAWLMHPDGSWARAEAYRTDAPTVHQGGPRRLWRELERIRHRLNMEGGLALYGCPVRITPDGVCHLSRGAWSATIG